MRFTELVEAILAFPAGTAIGTDRYHPRVLLRLSPSILIALMTLFGLCEILGMWPSVVTDVLIILLGKPAGGFRPIGFFPTFVRVWFRARSKHIRRWEQEHSRTFFYAGNGKGADTAAWLQAAVMENAALSRTAAAASLIDLTKAFERVSHVGLLAAAQRWDYPLWALRLSVAAYRLGRRVSVNSILSSVVVACRGITAGSSFATTELRLILLTALESLAHAYPALPLFIYVDDMFLAATGTPRHVCKVLTDATTHLVRALQAERLEVSATKSEGIASDPRLCAMLSAALRQFGVTFTTSCKSLGVDITASLGRATAVQRKRLRTLRARRTRIGRLRKATVVTARLFRTGVTAALTWGVHTVGVATTTLLQWRREVARGCAAAAAGKSVDLVLMLADSTPSAKTDPAFDAHILPIGFWANAVFDCWRPRAALALDVAAAKQRLCKASCLWKAVTGPASAFVASALRLGWTVHDYSHVTDDAGNKFDLARDPPALVKQMVAESVRRWQVARVDRTFSSADLGGTLRLAPLAKLLRTSSPLWGPAERAQLHSAIVGGQWTQLRLYRAGRAESPLCVLCGAAPLVVVRAP
jgi:hypothetical protein